MSLTLHQLQLALGTVCVAFAGVFVYLCIAPLQAFEPPAVKLAPREPLAQITPFTAPPQASFDVIDARPVFNPNRQPITPSPLPGNITSGPPPAPDVALVGVILDSKTQLALVKAQGAPFASSYRVGETVGGWQVAEVGPDHVTLRVGAFEHVLRMDEKRQTVPSQPPALGPQSTGSGSPFQQPNLQSGNGPQGQDATANTRKAQRAEWGNHGNPQE